MSDTEVQHTPCADCKNAACLMDLCLRLTRVETIQQNILEETRMIRKAVLGTGETEPSLGTRVHCLEVWKKSVGELDMARLQGVSGAKAAVIGALASGAIMLLVQAAMAALHR